MAIQTDAAAATRKAIKDQRKVLDFKRAQRDKAINALFASPDGREFLRWLLAIGKFGANSYRGEALATAFACGEQNVGAQIWTHLIQTNPHAFAEFLKENEEHARTDASRASAVNDAEPELALDDAASAAAPAANGATGVPITYR